MGTVGIEWERGQGDTGPPLATQLRHPRVGTEYDGAPVDLTEVSSVIGVVRRQADREVVHEAPAALLEAVVGKIELGLQPAVTAKEGIYAVEFAATWSTNWQQRFPTEVGNSHNYLLVRPQLMSQSVPIMPSGPPPGGGGVPEDGDTVTVTAGETLAALRAVELTPAGAIAFEPDVSNAGSLLGVTSTAAAIGNDIDVVTSGPLNSSGAGLTTGAHYYVAPDGVLTATQPTSGLLVYVGYAADPDTFVVQPGDPIALI